MIITAFAINRRIIVNIESDLPDIGIERKKTEESDWKVFTGNGYSARTELTRPVYIKAGDFLDNYDLADGIYQYRIFNPEQTETGREYLYSTYILIGGSSGTGYTFNNYKAPEGLWGEAVTPDDIRFTYLWGTDFKATNGQPFTDEQIRFFIESSAAEVGRMLNIQIRKQRIRSNAEARGLKKGEDYDIEESPYDFRYSRISRYGYIQTLRKPVSRLHKLTLLSRFSESRNLTSRVILDRPKGVIKLLERPVKPTETAKGIQTAIGMYGAQTMEAHLFYAIDYDAGYENSDEIPEDLRQIIGKHCAVSMLNIIGDGLMSGFSSSSLSMDGISESFSSTQSATSAYFGARIKEYKEDIDNYVKANKNKFANLVIGSI